jgi:hypothetical protein
MLRGLAAIIAAILLMAGQSVPAAAEANTLRAAKQYGLGYVQYMLMEDQKLVEKRAKAAGLGDIAVEWNTFRSSDVMNDALLSGSVDFVSLGVPGLMTIWDRTKGLMDVKGASGLNAMPIGLMVRDDNMREGIRGRPPQQARHHRHHHGAPRRHHRHDQRQQGRHGQLLLRAVSEPPGQDARHSPPADLDRHPRRAVLLQRRGHDRQDVDSVASSVQTERRPSLCNLPRDGRKSDHR